MCSNIFETSDEDDDNGLSLRRAKHVSLAEAAISLSNPGKKFYVAKLRAGDLRREGMELLIDPEDQGHILISNMTYALRGDTRVKNWKTQMAEKMCEVVDPASGAVVWRPA